MHTCYASARGDFEYSIGAYTTTFYTFIIPPTEASLIVLYATNHTILILEENGNP